MKSDQRTEGLPSKTLSEGVVDHTEIAINSVESSVEVLKDKKIVHLNQIRSLPIVPGQRRWRQAQGLMTWLDEAIAFHGDEAF